MARIAASAQNFSRNVQASRSLEWPCRQPSRALRYAPTWTARCRRTSPCLALQEERCLPLQSQHAKFSSAAICLSAAAGFSLPSSMSVQPFSCTAAAGVGQRVLNSDQRTGLIGRLSRMVFWPDTPAKPMLCIVLRQAVAQADPLPDRRFARVYGDVAAGAQMMTNSQWRWKSSHTLAPTTTG